MSKPDSRPVTPDSAVPLAVLPLNERFSAFRQRQKNLEDARKKLFADGEQALASGLRQLAEDAQGTKMKIELSGRQREIIRQPLTEPTSGAYSAMLPKDADGIRYFMDTLSLSSYALNAETDFWVGIPTSEFDHFLILGARVGGESFELTMQYQPERPFDQHAPVRRDSDVVNFSGFSSRRFETAIDRVKEINSTDALTKLSAALAIVKIVAGLRK